MKHKSNFSQTLIPVLLPHQSSQGLGFPQVQRIQLGICNFFLIRLVIVAEISNWSK